MSRQPKTKHKDAPTERVRRAHIPSDLTYEHMSELGRDLFDLSRAFEADGGALLSEDEIAAEIARRRGGHTPEDDN